MGVSVQQWRAVIGSWCSSGGSVPTTWRLDDVSADSRAVPLLLLAALLVIGGVEWNPGPKDVPKLYKDTKDNLTPVSESQWKQQVRELRKQLKDEKNISENHAKKIYQLERKIEKQKLEAKNETDKLQQIKEEQIKKTEYEAKEKSQLEMRLAEQIKKAENFVEQKLQFEQRMEEQKRNTESLAAEKSQLEQILEEKEKEAENQAKEKSELELRLEKAEQLAKEKTQVERKMMEQRMNAKSQAKEMSQLEQKLEEKDEEAENLTKEISQLELGMEEQISKAENEANSKLKLEQIVDEQMKRAENVATEKSQFEQNKMSENLMNSKAETLAKENKYSFMKMSQLEERNEELLIKAEHEAKKKLQLELGMEEQMKTAEQHDANEKLKLKQIIEEHKKKAEYNAKEKLQLELRLEELNKKTENLAEEKLQLEQRMEEQKKNLESLAKDMSQLEQRTKEEKKKAENLAIEKLILELEMDEQMRSAKNEANQMMEFELRIKEQKNKAEHLAEEKLQLEKRIDEQKKTFERLAKFMAQLQQIMEEQIKEAGNLAEEKMCLKLGIKEHRRTTENEANDKILELELIIEEQKKNAEKESKEKLHLKQRIEEQEKNSESLGMKITLFGKSLKELNRNAETLAEEKLQLKQKMEEQVTKAENLAMEKIMLEQRLKELKEKAENVVREKSQLEQIMKEQQMKAESAANEMVKLEQRMNELKEKAENLDKEKTCLERRMEELKKESENIFKEKLQMEQIMEEQKEKAEKQDKERSRLELRMEELKKKSNDESTSDANAGCVIIGKEPGVKKYKQTPGRVNMKGPFFEIKMAALIYIRAINSGQPFFLATNMEAAGVFDDIIIRTKIAGQDKWTTTLIQLKHKESATAKVSYASLLSLGKSDFNLVKYCESFSQIKAFYYMKYMYVGHETDWPWDGEFDDFRFVFYTNSQSDDDLNTNETEAKVSLDKLLISNLHGSAFNFSTASRIYQYVKEIISFTDLLRYLSFKMDLNATDIADIIKFNLNSSQVDPYNKEFQSKKEILIQKPTKPNIQTTLKSLTLVPHLHSFEQFLENFYLYTGQSNEGQFDNLISQEIKRACHCSWEPELSELQSVLVDSVKKWWGDGNVEGSWLTEHSDVWSSLMSSRIAQLSHQKLSQLREVVVKYEIKALERTFKTLQENRQINILVKTGTNSIVASQVYQALVHHQAHNYIFTGAKEMLKRKVEMISVLQSSNLCQGLIIDCDQTLSDEETNDLASVLLEVLTSQDRLSVVLISDKHCGLTRALQPVLLQTRAVCQWSDLTSESQSELLKNPVMFQGHELPLSALVGNDVTQINQQLQGTGLAKLLNTEMKVGNDLEPLLDYYLPRRLTRDGKEVAIESLADIPDRVVVLIAEPGMGKSTLVTHLTQTAKLADPSTWVVRVNLNDCSEYLAKLDLVNINKAIAIDFLTRFARATDWEEVIFKHRLLVSGKIVLFMDGVDEVCPFYETTVCSLLQELLNTKIQTLWVISRHVARASLENVLNARSFALVPFSIEDQKQFFGVLWEKEFDHAKRSPDEFLRKVVEISLEGISRGDLSSAIPQQTRMLAEYFAPHLYEFLKTGSLSSFPQKINILNLYESFVEKKLKDYSLEKRKDDCFNAAVKIDRKFLDLQYRKRHMHAAMIALLTVKELAEIDLPASESHQIDSLQRTGIINEVVNGKPYFVSRSFAELFAALWISENYQRAIPFLRRNLLEPRFHYVKSFLDLKLCTSKLHEAVINRDVETVKSLSADPIGFKLFYWNQTNINQVDSGGRTALHLSATKNSLDNEMDCVQITHELLTHRADIELKDKLLQWRPLQYADRTCSWKVAMLLLQVGGREDDMAKARNIIKADVFDTFIEFLSNPNQSPDNLMLLASRHGDIRVVQFLVDECEADVNCRGHLQSTPMHWCACGGHIDLMRFLLGRNASCIELSVNNAQPIHYASTAQVVELLIENGASVNALDNSGYSPLARSLLLSHVDATKCLLKHGADLEALKEFDFPHWKSFSMGLIDFDQFLELRSNY